MQTKPLTEAAKRQESRAMKKRGLSLATIQTTLGVRRRWLLDALGLPPDPKRSREPPPSFDGVPSLPRDLASLMGDSCPPLTEEQEAAADRAIAAATGELRKRQQANPSRQPSVEIPRVRVVIGNVRGGAVSL